MTEQNIQYEKTLQKGISLLKNNPNAIIDIIQVANRLSYLRGRLFEQSHRKKDATCISGKHLETRSKLGEDKIRDSMPNDTENHDDNPQDDPGKASGADNGDTGNSTFPADSTSKAARKILKRLRQRNSIVNRNNGE